MYHKLYDERVNCISILVEMQLGEYLSLVEGVYAESGGIEGQRGPLKTKTGITIRNRLVSDIQQRALMPPVVLGVLLDKEGYDRARNAAQLSEFLAIAMEGDRERISIIDGMQRTTAMAEASKSDPQIRDMPIRVEFWVSDRLNSLIYRMLVLNTGQVPWEVGRQLETVYTQFLGKIKNDLGDDADIFLIDNQRRRVQAGQYQSKNVIELLLLFSSRKLEIDIRDRIAEDFTRLDAIETTSHSEFLEYFIECLRLISRLDSEFSRVVGTSKENLKIRSGKDIFSSFPAMAGFCTAVAVEVFDEPGFPIDWHAAHEKMKSIEASVDGVVVRLREMGEGPIAEFLQLQLLEERLSQRSTQVGRFEREFFKRAFTAMFKNAARLPDMTPCWMA